MNIIAIADGRQTELRIDAEDLPSQLEICRAECPDITATVKQFGSDGAVLYHIYPDRKGRLRSSDVLSKTDSKASFRAADLSRFIQGSIQDGTQNYMIVLGTGSGFQQIIGMKISEFREGLANAELRTGIKLDGILFSASTHGYNFEGLNEIREQADFAIAWRAFEKAGMVPWASLLQRMHESIQTGEDNRSLGKAFVAQFKQEIEQQEIAPRAITYVDFSSLKLLNQTLDALGGQRPKLEPVIEQLKNAVRESQVAYGDTGSFGLLGHSLHHLDTMRLRCNPRFVHEALISYHRAVPISTAVPDYPGTAGLSFFAPSRLDYQRQQSNSERYEDLRNLGDNWKELIYAISPNN